MSSALALLIERRLSLTRICAARLSCYEDAEDAVSETSVKAWQQDRRAAFVDDRAAAAWLYRVAHNACLDILRARRSRPVTACAINEWTPAHDDVEATVMARETLRAVDAAMAAEAAPFRVAIAMTAQGYNRTEIHAATGMATGSVATRAFRARKRIRAASV